MYVLMYYSGPEDNYKIYNAIYFATRLNFYFIMSIYVTLRLIASLFANSVVSTDNIFITISCIFMMDRNSLKISKELSKTGSKTTQFHKEKGQTYNTPDQYTES